MLSQYKYLILAIIFAIWSAAIWHVSSTYTKAEYLKRDLATITTNIGTASEFGKIVEDKIAALKPQTTVINRNITNEIAKDTVYLDCKSSPNVMREYQQKLYLQPK